MLENETIEMLEGLLRINKAQIDELSSVVRGLKLQKKYLDKKLSQEKMINQIGNYEKD